MPTDTVLQTGTDLELEVGGLDYAPQTSSVTLARTLNRERHDTIRGPVYKTTTQEGSLSVTLFTDWGSTGSLLEALDDAATTDPDESLPFSFQHGGAVFAGKVFPVHPDAGGEAPNVTEVTVELTLDAGTPVTRDGVPV